MNNNILLEFKRNVQLEKTDKNYTIGTVILLIYSNETFKNNKDIIPFLKDVFNETYLPYVIKSRTLVAAKLGRTLAQKEEKEFEQINEGILIYFNSINSSDNKKVNKKKGKKNANEKLDSWLGGI